MSWIFWFFLILGVVIVVAIIKTLCEIARDEEEKDKRRGFRITPIPIKKEGKPEKPTYEQVHKKLMDQIRREEDSSQGEKVTSSNPFTPCSSDDPTTFRIGFSGGKCVDYYNNDDTLGAEIRSSISFQSPSPEDATSILRLAELVRIKNRIKDDLCLALDIVNNENDSLIPICKKGFAGRIWDAVDRTCKFKPGESNEVARISDMINMLNKFGFPNDSAILNAERNVLRALREEKRKEKQ